MRKLGFDEVWISRLMTCVTIISYAVLINGQPDPVITPFRGIRRGDPISLYLYLICVEGLSMLLNEIKKSSKITGAKVTRGSLTINHLFFTDNIIILWHKIQSLLDAYEATSG